MLIQIFLGFILTATAVIGTRILDVNFGVSAFCGPLNDLSDFVGKNFLACWIRTIEVLGIRMGNLVGFLTIFEKRRVIT